MKFKVFGPLFVSMLMISFAGMTGCGGGTPDEPEKPTPVEPSTPNKPDVPTDPLPVAGLSFNTIMLSNEGDIFACPIHGLGDGEWSSSCEQSWCKTSSKGNVVRIGLSRKSVGKCIKIGDTE